MTNPARIEARRERDRRIKDRRNIFFCAGFSKKWPITLHKVFERLKTNHNLKWIRIRVVYKTFPNLNLLLNSDLVCKVNQGLKCRKIGSKPCSCKGEMKNNCIWTECVEQKMWYIK